MATPNATPTPSVRLDVWLWAARFFKTRSLAKAAIESGKVEVDAQAAKPSRTIRAGQRLRIARGEERIELDVLGLSELRGSAPVAQALYRETEGSLAARVAARESRRLGRAGYTAPPGKPDKRSRRELIRFIGGEPPENS